MIRLENIGKQNGKQIVCIEASAALQKGEKIGLVGTNINVETGQWTNTGSHMSAEIDSYYEYLYKCWLLFGDKECKQMWDDDIASVNKFLADEVRGELWYGHADMTTGKRTRTTSGALDAFFPGLLALSGDIPRARRLRGLEDSPRSHGAAGRVGKSAASVRLR